MRPGIAFKFTAVILLAMAITNGAVAETSGHANAASADAGPLVPSIDIDYHRFVLDNGLTLLVHEDHATPVVAISMWYHVGSKNEGPDQHGFAHLFEHLMFQGTEHWHGEYFEPFERAGATNMNGTTNTDRTNYYATVPTPALDMALWMESDRMGHLLGGIDKATMNEQVGVVINEKHQDENQPYGKVWQLLPKNTYPHNHPYSWPTIGSEKDLKAATLSDVKHWFKTYYGPSNAVLVLSGDITPEDALKKVKHYFGNIPAGPPVTHQKSRVAPMNGEHRMVVHGDVPHARLYMVWNVPPMGTAAANRLQLAARALAGAKTSPLYKTLVFDDEIALNVNAGLIQREIGSQFLITATARPGVSLDKVEGEIRTVLQTFLDKGPDQDALKRSKTRITAGFVRQIESNSGKARVLAQGQLYHDNPAHYKKALQTLREATPDSVRQTADQWLNGDDFVLSVLPFGKHGTHDTDVDRSHLPAIGAMPDLDLPKVQIATLSNGMTVRLAEDHDTPIVQMNMVFDAGYAADPGKLPGLSNMTMTMLDEGTKNKGALEISAALGDLGATFSAGSSLDDSTADMSALASRLPESLALYADLIQHPAFPERALQRNKKQALATIAREKHTPTSLALRKLGPLLFGADNAYGQPLTGTGTVDAVKAMTRDDLRQFTRNWLRPDNATLVVVGDTTMAEIKPLLEQDFGNWKAPNEPLPKKHIAHADRPDHTRIFLINRPGSTQTTIIAGSLAPPRENPSQVDMRAVNTILGGMFNSRLNMFLREKKHWSYGAGSVLMTTRAQRPFFAYSSVQTDKTVPAIQAIRHQIQAIDGDKPPTDDELSLATASLTRSLPGRNETTGQLAATLTHSVVYGLPPDYYDKYISNVQALTADELPSAAKELLAPGAMTWIVVGDLNQFGDAVKKLDWATVKTLDD